MNLNLPIPGLILIEGRAFRDDRGFFTERYNQETYRNAGFTEVFVQDNFSRSLPGVIRGMHFQHDKPQGKLVTCSRSRILDVVIDLRWSEPTFRKHYAVELDGEEQRSLWVPAGFAHGFCVLGNEVADVTYKVNAIYNSKGEVGLRWNDPAFAIDWPVVNAQLSPKDAQAPDFKSYLDSELGKRKWWELK